MKGRLFCAVLAEGQLQLPVPAVLPKKRFSKKSIPKHFLISVFISQSYRLSVNSRLGKDCLCADWWRQSGARTWWGRHWDWDAVGERGQWHKDGELGGNGGSWEEAECVGVKLSLEKEPR